MRGMCLERKGAIATQIANRTSALKCSQSLMADDVDGGFFAIFSHA